MTVTFNIKGNRWEKNGMVNYITNLNALTITKGIAVTEAGTKQLRNVTLEDSPSPSPDLDDLPF